MARLGVVTALQIERVDELFDALREGSSFWISGSGTHAPFRRSATPKSIAITIGISGLVRHDSADQVVVCKGNTPLSLLQNELKLKGQCIPYLPFFGRERDMVEAVKGTVAGHLSMNLPHSYEAAHGGWKDWLLGAKLILANGLSAKCGSQVVKNVAGYDLHKLLIGARGTVGVITELTLRTLPIKALEPPDLIVSDREVPIRGVIERCLPSDFEQLVHRYGEDVLATHPRTSTLYRTGVLKPGQDGISSGWELGWGNGDNNIPPQTKTYRSYFARLKQSFDPDLKLNAREWGDL